MTLTTEAITETTLDAAPKKNPMYQAWKLTSTERMMQGLVDDHPKNESILLGVAWNPVTSRNVLEFLTNNEYPRVAAAAKNRLESLNESR